MTRPKILFVSPRIPHPLNSGTKIRIDNLVKGLAQVGDVDLLCYGFPQEFDELTHGPDTTPDWWTELNSVQVLRHPAWPFLEPPFYKRRIARRPFATEGLLYSTFPGAPLHEIARPLAEQADLIWIERLYAAPGLSSFARKMIIDLDDLESVKVAREAESESIPYMGWAMRKEAARLARTERQSINQYAKVVVCSPQDTTHFKQDADRVWVLPNGVDDSLIDKRGISPEPKHLVFVGTMNYGPNEDAMLYFCREILPRICAKVPDVVLSIVGLKPPLSIKSLHDGKTILVHANVPEVAPYVQRASLSIVPLRVGGGTRLKILESLALGTPVISTRVGAEGLDLLHGEHLLLADTPEEFAEAVTRSLTDPDMSRRLAEQGLDRVRQLYLWSSIRNQLASECGSLMEALAQRSD